MKPFAMAWSWESLYIGSIVEALTDTWTEEL
jgi:hypothetical protein